MAPSHDPKVALITGAARRIGRAIACALAEQDWKIAVHHYASVDDAHALCNEIASRGGTAIPIQANLSDLKSVNTLVPECARRLAPPTCIVNNASAFQPDHVPALREALWETHLDINLKTPVFLAQDLVRHLPEGANGNVINIIDQRVWRLTPDFFSYTISKAGLWTATRTLAQALAPRVRVNAVGPGPVLKSIHQSDQDFSNEVASTLLKKAPAPEDIARAIQFILTTPAMTGQMIALDSGQHLTWSGETPG